MHGECSCFAYMVTILRLLRLVGFGFDVAPSVDGSVGVTAGVGVSVGDDVVDVDNAASFLAANIVRSFS